MSFDRELLRQALPAYDPTAIQSTASSTVPSAAPKLSQANVALW